jgi:hypothetical protein
VCWLVTDGTGVPISHLILLHQLNTPDAKGMVPRQMAINGGFKHIVEVLDAIPQIRSGGPDTSLPEFSPSNASTTEEELVHEDLDYEFGETVAD